MTTVRDQWLSEAQNDSFNAAGMMENNWGQSQRPTGAVRLTWVEDRLRSRVNSSRKKDGKARRRATDVPRARSVKWIWMCALLFLSVLWCFGDVTQQDTTMPNRFEFTQAEYVVGEDATYAEIAVRFYPGNRGVAGSVRYITEGDTALGGEDYVAVSGDLRFSGWESAPLRIPIIWDDLDEGDEIIRLRLVGTATTMVGPQATATLRITNVRPRPRLRVTAATDGLPTLSWPDDGETWILEKCSDPLSGNWTPVTDLAAKASGRLSVTDTRCTPVVFYRLRKP
jgi:hypothetical protein